MDGKTPIKLLLVDDEEDFRTATRQVLARRGFEVSEASSGEESLQTIRASRPDVVLLDLRMPGMDGIDTLRAIREIEPDLPVIILTGHGRLDDVLAGINLEIVDFLQKPVDVEQLAERMQKLLVRDKGRPLRERTVGELVVPVTSYRRVYVDQPLRDAVDAVRHSFYQQIAGRVTEQGHRSVLVYDRQERFVGVLRVRDVIGALIPPFMRGSPYSSFFTGMFLAQSKLLGRRDLAELVDTRPPIQVDTPLMEAVHEMDSRRVINLPVLQEGELVGILRDKDLLLEIAACMIGD